MELADAVDVEFTSVTLQAFEWMGDTMAFTLRNCQRCVIRSLVVDTASASAFGTVISPLPDGTVEFGPSMLYVAGQSSVTVDSVVVTALNALVDATGAPLDPSTYPTSASLVHVDEGSTVAIASVNVSSSVLTSDSALFIARNSSTLSVASLSAAGLAWGTDGGAAPVPGAVTAALTGSSIAIAACNITGVSMDITALPTARSLLFASDGGNLTLGPGSRILGYVPGGASSFSLLDATSAAAVSASLTVSVTADPAGPAPAGSAFSQLGIFTLRSVESVPAVGGGGGALVTVAVPARPPAGEVSITLPQTPINLANMVISGVSHSAHTALLSASCTPVSCGSLVAGTATGGCSVRACNVPDCSLQGPCSCPWGATSPSVASHSAM
jgi:hypothetical protein